MRSLNLEADAKSSPSPQLKRMKRTCWENLKALWLKKSTGKREKGQSAC
jgi:hypothetical protein